MASSSSSGRKAVDELFQAASAGNVDLFKMRNSLLLLFRCASTGDLAPIKDLVESFKEKGESFLEKALGVRNENGMSVLHFAAAGGSKKVCQYLLETGKFDINMKDTLGGETTLHHAILNGRFPAAAFLLHNGADPNVETKLRRTALHYTIEHVAGSKDLMQLIISKGADVNAVADIGTPLQCAAQRGKAGFVKLLLEHRADPNVVSHDLRTPLVGCIHSQSVECMELLLEAGADPNFSSSIGVLILGYAASYGSKDIIRCLLKGGAHPDAVDIQGITPVVHAAASNRPGVVKILFPKTSPISTIPQWTISGLFEYVRSDNAIEESKRKALEMHLVSKSQGDECAYQKDYFGAIQWYTQAKTFCPNDCGILSQRSQCWAKLNAGGLALEDALACIRVRPCWEAYHLEGAARMLLKDYKMAACAFSNGLKLDPGNAVLERAYWEAIEARKNSNYFEI